jgi:diketogulonate reductase-like aldo/keto reductase
MKEVVLNNGVKMPAIGFGVFQVFDQKVALQAVSDALEVGYRHIDTAATYMNEEAVGAAVRESGLRREDVFVTSKVWVQDHGYDETLRAFDTTMRKLGLDYLDLYLIHKPYGDYYATWRALEHLYHERRIRAIGVTSFWNERLQDLFLHNEVKPAVNQVETNVWYQQRDTEDFLRSEGIQMQAWAPFAEGNGDVFHNTVLQQIARKHGVTTGQVQLRWLNQRGIVALPKTVHKERMRENLDIFGFTLDESDLQAIVTLDTGRSTIYDDKDLATVRGIGTFKFHD